MSETPIPIDERFGRRLIASIGKTRQRGWSWLFNRARREIQIPTSAPGRVLRNALASIERGALRGIAKIASALPTARPSSRDTLYFFLDLEVSPITFDVVTFLATAELYRRRHGLKDIHVILVPGTVGGLREEGADFAAAMGPEARWWRLHNLVIPIFRLLPSCTGYTVCSSRREAYTSWFAGAAHVFPEGYSVAFPTLSERRGVSDAAHAGEAVLPMLRATPQALDHMRRFLEPRAAGRRVVVLNLRRFDYMAGRNSNDANWIAFARELDKSRWMPVFVLDTAVALDPKPPELEEFVVCDAVPFNIELRMALYELVDLTMSVAQGPMELCWLNHRCNYAMFVKPGSSAHTTDESYRERGYDIGKGPPFMASNHRWVWEYDELHIIRSVFAEIAAAQGL